MALISRLGVVLGLDTSEFVKGLGIADTKLKDFGSKVKTGLASAVALAGAEMIAATKQAADYADEMYKAAQKVGVTTEELSKLRYAADLSDVEFDKLRGGLVKLSKSMLDAQTSGGDIAQVFKDLKINITDAEGKLRPTADVFADISERFKNMNDGATKSALALKIFSKSGAELIPLLNEGKAGLKSAADEAERFGMIVDDKAGKAAQDFNDNMERMGKVVHGAQIQFGNKLLPAFSSTLEYMVKMSKEGKTLEGVLLGIGLAINKLIFGADFGTELYNLNEGIKSATNQLENARDKLNRALTREPNFADKLFGDVHKLEIASAENSIGEALAKITDLTHKRDQLLKQQKAEAQANKPSPKDDQKLTVDSAQKLLDKTNEQILAYEKQKQALAGVTSEVSKLQLEFGKGGKFEGVDATSKQRLLDKAAELDAAKGMADYEQRRSEFMLQMRDMGIEITHQAEERADRQRQEVDAQVEALQLQARRNEYEAQLVGLSDTQKEKALEYFDLKEKVVALGKDPLWQPDQVEAITEATQRLIEMQETNRRAQRTFQAGWDNAWENFKERASDSFSVGQKAFNSMTNSMSTALDEFVSHGKFSFGQFTASVLQDLLKIYMRMQMMSLFKSIGGLFNFGGGDSLGGVAADAGAYGIESNPYLNWTGPTAAGGGNINGPTLVGEMGPELFIPSSSGTVIPNNQLSSALGGGGQVVYNGPVIQNMSAIDTQSGIQFLVKNKDTIWAANQSANRALPMSR